MKPPVHLGYFYLTYMHSVLITPKEHLAARWSHKKHVIMCAGHINTSCLQRQTLVTRTLILRRPGRQAHQELLVPKMRFLDSARAFPLRTAILTFLGSQGSLSRILSKQAMPSGPNMTVYPDYTPASASVSSERLQSRSPGVASQSTFFLIIRPN